MKKRSGQAGSVKVRSRTQAKRTSKSSPFAVFLVGFMGAGKTSVGRTLAERLNRQFEDLDDRIERREGQSVAEIFRDRGEDGFRRAEHAALQELIAELRGGGRKIIALGGGAFVQERNAALIAGAGLPSVFLDAPVEELWERCCRQASAAGAERPLLGSQDQFWKLYEARRAAYEKASVTIQTGKRSLEALAEEIAATLGLGKIVRRSEQGEAE